MEKTFNNLGNCFKLFLILITSFASKSQAQLPWDVQITSSTTVKACDINTYNVEISSPNGSTISNVPITVSFAIVQINSSGLHIPISATSCEQSPIPDFMNVLVLQNGTPIASVFDPINLTLTFDSDLPVLFDLNIPIDCSIIPVSSNGISLAIDQTWTSSSVNFDVNQTTSDFHSDPIAYPYIISPSSQVYNFLVNYNNEYYLEYHFQNTSSTEVEIDFQFSNSPVICGGYDFSPNVDVWEVEQNGTITSIGTFFADGIIWNNGIIIGSNAKLKIRRKIKIIDCVSLCIAESATFNWRCNALNQTNSCEHCIKNIIIPFQISHEISNLNIVRLDNNTPVSLTGQWDNSCFDITEKKPWKYRITNPGTETIDNVKLLLQYPNGNTNGKSKMTLIYEDDIVIDLNNCPTCSTATVNPILTYKIDYSCISPTGAAIVAWEYTILDMGPGASIDFEFTTERCLEQDDIILGMDKFFNLWNIDVTAHDICGIQLDVIDEFSLTYSPYFQISPTNHAVSNLDLITQFTPLVSNVTVYNNVPPDPIELEINLIQLFSNPAYTYDEQILGCSQNSPLVCPYVGYLRVTINTASGLIMDNFANVRITKPGYSPWEPVYYNTPSSGCNDSEYFFYFDMSDVSYPSDQPHFA